MPEYRIVLIEDSPDDVLLVREALRRSGIECRLLHFGDGESAIRELERAGAEVPDLFLIDLNLPKAEGADVLRLIRLRPRFVGVRAGILTSSRAESDRHRIGLLGADRYITKPVLLDEFVREVGSAVRELLKVPQQP
jgi:DNA-binding response OmpR family regulator